MLSRELCLDGLGRSDDPGMAIGPDATDLALLLASFCEISEFFSISWNKYIGLVQYRCKILKL